MHLPVFRRPDLARPAPRGFARALSVAVALLLCLAGAATRAAVPYAPDDIVSPARRIDAEKLPPPWSDLVKELQGKGSLFATFTENRYLPFKKVPVVFTGELRLSPDHGLSLHYTAPETRTMIVDTQGVVLRDEASGRSREVPADPRALAATSALLQVMRFDFSALARSFSTYAAGDRELWHLAFEPKDEALSRNLSRIVVDGERDQVRRIQLRKSSLQSIEILIGDVREGATFSAEEMKRFFR